MENPVTVSALPALARGAGTGVAPRGPGSPGWVVEDQGGKRARSHAAPAVAEAGCVGSTMFGKTTAQ